MRVRNNAFLLRPDAKQQFIDAFETKKAEVLRITSAHAQMRVYRMHARLHRVEDPIGAARFLPWHRALLIDFERALERRPV